VLVRFALWLALATAAAGAALAAVSAADAARDRRRRPPVCPADEDEPAPWPARTLAGLVDLARESGLAALGLLGLPFALRPAVARGAGRPIVVVTGPVAYTAGALWLRSRLRRDGWCVVHAVTRGRVDAAAVRLGDVVDRLRREPAAAAVDVVAHGRGGLVARAWLRGRGRGAGVGRLVTLGTPHQGTVTLPWLERVPTLAELRPNGPVLARLATDDPVPAIAECIAVYSAADALVVPPSAGYYPAAFNIEVQGLGHLSLLAAGRVYELIRENLAAASAPRVSAP
jgi:hypothetical protein